MEKDIGDDNDYISDEDEDDDYYSENINNNNEEKNKKTYENSRKKIHPKKSLWIKYKYNNNINKFLYFPYKKMK